MKKLTEFTDRTSFDLWHNSMKTKLGIPKVGFRASDGTPQPEKQQTTDYTKPILNDDGIRVIANIKSNEIISENFTPITKNNAKARGFFGNEESIGITTV